MYAAGSSGGAYPLCARRWCEPSIQITFSELYGPSILKDSAVFNDNIFGSWASFASYRLHLFDDLFVSLQHLAEYYMLSI
mmetsp:Transcript_33672/g.65038  ORF Transcript_33672/g.65038 Transcript_33672/m.65038 type:complete len:80 (-) Transcript_33672:798-1037(-)